MQRLFILTLLLPFALKAQLAQLSRYEWCWALGHPFAALQVKKISRQANVIYKQAALLLELDAYSGGGRRDAFRHTFYMAAFAQKVKARKLRKLGLAHEKANYHQFLHARQEEGEVPDSLSSVMDLQNNELGFAIGKAHKHLPLDSLKQIVIQEIKQGKAVIMKRRKDGVYLDCSNTPLAPALLAKVWNQPKCLVPSNYTYSN